MKIAILGTAPSSLPLAPLNDPDWTIWACGLAYKDQLPRIDAWFELHDLSILKQEKILDSDYSTFLKKQPKVYMQKVNPNIAGSVEYPLEEMVGLYGPHFFTSTISYMLALAIKEEPEEIGLWGIDMAADSEYQQQKQGALYFVQKAVDKGIKIVTPPQSDFLKSPPLYGFKESGWMYKKLYSRQKEIKDRLMAAKQRKRQAEYEEDFLSGAMDDINYMLRTWT